ncbi:hypothetical protein HAX54_014861, partial [Datura stramonium]|nr:hypothetical protein [Datura stramonium]
DQPCHTNLGTTCGMKRFSYCKLSVFPNQLRIRSSADRRNSRLLFLKAKELGFLSKVQ